MLWEEEGGHDDWTVIRVPSFITMTHQESSTLTIRRRVRGSASEPTKNPVQPQKRMIIYPVASNPTNHQTQSVLALLLMCSVDCTYKRSIAAALSCPGFNVLYHFGEIIINPHQFVLLLLLQIYHSAVQRKKKKGCKQFVHQSFRA